MDGLTIGGAVVALVVLTALLVWRLRVRSATRLQWQATRQRDWTTDELDALRSESAA
jgi:hypothetical protein